MNQQELDDLKEKLEAQRVEVLNDIETHEKILNAPPANRDFAGADRAQELEDREVDAALVESKQNLLPKIERALQRIEEGDYGVCESCGQDIPLARLEVKPNVSLCLSCQTEHESIS